MSWYHKPTSSGQALVISETTGANVAVAYDAGNGPLLAAAPALLDEARAFLADFEAYINSDDCDLPDSSGLRAAIARAEGRNT